MILNIGVSILVCTAKILSCFLTMFKAGIFYWRTYNGIITLSAVWLLCNINTEGCTQISFQERLKGDTEAFLKQLKVVLHDAGDEVASELQEVLETLKKIQPDVKAVVSSYQNQLKILKEELENDEGFTGASENVLVKL